MRRNGQQLRVIRENPNAVVDERPAVDADSEWRRGFVCGFWIAAVVVTVTTLAVNALIWNWARGELERKAAPINHEWKEDDDARNGVRTR